MYNVAIVGAGQLGSRHLQGLKKADLEMAVYLVDTSPDALKVAESRYNEIAENPKISQLSLLTQISKLPPLLDLVIIATSSAVRAAVTRELIAEKKIKNLLFEKFLFPKIADYKVIAGLLKENNIKAWVNCPRRTFPLYKELKEHFSNKGPLSFSLTGGDWGLACNSIHFIDIFSMLSGEDIFEMDLTELNKTVHESKRAGYIEFTGTIKGITSSGGSFSLSSIHDSKENPVLSISAGKLTAEIKESAGEMTLNGNNGTPVNSKFQFLYQSQLTGAIAEQILLTGQSDLTSYDASAALHLQFLGPVVNFYNTLTGKSGDSCPIT